MRRSKGRQEEKGRERGRQRGETEGHQLNQLYVGVLSGVANSAAQDAFCLNTKCEITIIYDQSGMTNHLTVGTPGGQNPKGNTAADATAEAVHVNGKKVYSVYIKPGNGYFHDGSKKGIVVRVWGEREGRKKEMGVERKV